MPKTQCIKGHEYTPENTIWRRQKNGNPTRRCKQCVAMEKSRHRKIKKSMGDEELEKHIAKQIHQAIPGRDKNSVEYTPFCLMIARVAIEAVRAKDRRS